MQLYVYKSYIYIYIHVYQMCKCYMNKTWICHTWLRHLHFICISNLPTVVQRFTAELATHLPTVSSMVISDMDEGSFPVFPSILALMRSWNVSWWAWSHPTPHTGQWTQWTLTPPAARDRIVASFNANVFHAGKGQHLFIVGNVWKLLLIMRIYLFGISFQIITFSCQMASRGPQNEIKHMFIDFLDLCSTTQIGFRSLFL